MKPADQCGGGAHVYQRGERDPPLLGLLAAAAGATLATLAAATRGLGVVCLSEVGSSEMASATRVGNVALCSALNLSRVGLAHWIIPSIAQMVASGAGQMTWKSILREKVSLNAQGRETKLD
jgi:hypothetical protein